jgi:two-component system, cell cycle sensor histidine kinase and response regulator CckA
VDISNKMYRRIIEAMPEGIWVVDCQGRTIFSNRRMAEMLETDFESMSEQSCLGWVFPEELDDAQRQFARNMGGDTRPFDFRLRRANGSPLWVSISSMPVQDEAGAMVGMLGLFSDITERRRTEAALRESEERFRNMADEAPVMIWVTDTNKRATFFNKCCLDFTGRTMEDKLGDGWSANLHPDDRERFLNVFCSSIDAREEFRSVFRFRRADGEYRWVLSTGVPRFAPDGVFSGYIGSCVDITDQKLATEQVKASEARLITTQRLVRVGSWDRNITSDRIDWSDEMLRILGVRDKPPSSFQDFLNCVHPEDREKILQVSAQARSKSAPVDVEYRIVRPDGEVRDVRSVIQAIRDQQGVPLHVAGATQDITDFKRSQAESFARQKLESVGTLAGGIAHDFNNLLGGVLAQADVALSEVAAGVSPEEELQAIRKVAIRGSEIVRELMIYAGKETAVVGQVDISRIVSEMLELLKVSVSKHAVLETDLAKDLPFVEANAAQIRQIVMNLVTNASEAIGDRDGIICVTTALVKGAVRAPEGNSGQPADGDYIELKISDTGCGMSRETQARVFDPFFTTKAAGHGLGLAIVYGLVRGLGGAIHLTSELDNGTTVQILIPGSQARAVSANEVMAGEPSAPRPEGITVLVIEDEDILRNAVVKILRNSGFAVFEAAEGTSAIDILRAKGASVDAILLDMTIPGASTREIVAEAAQRRPDIKVLLTSAYTKEMITGEMTAPQICGFLRKPFPLDDLLRVIRSALFSS